MLGRVYVRWDHLRRCADFQSSREMEGQCSMAIMGPGLTHVGSINFRFLFILPYSAPTTVPRPAYVPGLTELPPHACVWCCVLCAVCCALMPLVLYLVARFSWKTTAVWGHRGLGADNSACT